MNIKSNATVRMPKIIIWLVGLFLVFSTGFYFFKDTGDEAFVKIISTSSDGELLSIPRDFNGDLSEMFIELHADRRAEVAQNLLEFRVRYRQLDPQVKVSLLRASPDLSTFLDRFVALLVEQNLAKPLDRESQHLSEIRIPATQAGVVFRGASKDDVITKRFLKALSPYLTGTVHLSFDERLTPGDIEIYVTGRPCFDKYGAVSFLPADTDEQRNSGQAC